MKAVTELRLGLWNLDISPLPATGSKEVFWPGWTTRAINEHVIRSWERHRDWLSTGARTAYHPCLDLDIRHPEAVDACERLVRERYDGRGELLVRTGLAPKRLIPFRTDTPFAKRVMCYLAPNGERHKVEFLANGQQAIFYGYHEGAKRDYLWHADRDPLKVPPSEWPTITEIEADELLAAIDELLTEQYWLHPHHRPRRQRPVQVGGPSLYQRGRRLCGARLQGRRRWRQPPRHRARLHQCPHRQSATPREAAVEEVGAAVQPTTCSR